MNRNPDGLPSFTLHLSEEEAKQSVKELEAYNGTLKGGE